MQVALPEVLRPRNVHYKKCALGVDLPSSFFYDLKAIDNSLYPVWHEYSVLWEHDVMNDYTGTLEDSRRQINYDYGELNFGFVLKTNEDTPLSNPQTQGGGQWHIWRLCWPHGWAHVINLESLEAEYLDRVNRRLYLQGKYSDRYGHRAYNHYLASLEEGDREQQQKEQAALLDDINNENKWLIDKAAENFARGVTAPTNPMRESVYSYKGQTNRTKTNRPLRDEESGLIIPGA